MGHQVDALSSSKRGIISRFLNWLKEHFGKQEEPSASSKQQEEQDKEKEMEQKEEDQVGTRRG